MLALVEVAIMKKKIFLAVLFRLKKGTKATNLWKTKLRIWSELGVDSKSKDSFTDAAFLGEPVLIELVIKYSTAIPSSAAVECLFSTGKDVLRAKRLSLLDDNFNMLMFMKRNMHLMQNNDQ